MISSIDPINGHDVIGVLDHPSLVDGIQTIYFESDTTRTAYLDTPINHPTADYRVFQLMRMTGVAETITSQKANLPWHRCV